VAREEDRRIKEREVQVKEAELAEERLRERERMEREEDFAELFGKVLKHLVEFPKDPSQVQVM